MLALIHPMAPRISAMLDGQSIIGICKNTITAWDCAIACTG